AAGARGARDGEALYGPSRDRVFGVLEVARGLRHRVHRPVYASFPCDGGRMTLASRGRAVTVVALLLLVGVYVRVLAFTPLERFQGAAQKIFYLHVPAAWSAMLAMGLVGLASILFLLVKDPRYDRFAAASAEVGTAFCLVMLTTGPIWAKPIWGTWWTWDARLTLTLFLFFIFLGYLVLRG